MVREPGKTSGQKNRIDSASQVLPRAGVPQTGGASALGGVSILFPEGTPASGHAVIGNAQRPPTQGRRGGPTQGLSGV